MKTRFFFLLFLSIIISGNLLAQITEIKTLVPISTNIGKYSTGQEYDFSINALGKNLYGGTNTTISRSYHEFNLSDITEGATNVNITSVKVIYSTEIKSYTFKITKVNTISPENGGYNGANWNAIGSSTVMDQGIVYGSNNFTSTNIKTQMQNALPTNKLILGALSENEVANDSYSILSLILEVTYTRAAGNFTLYARNDFEGIDGGQIGVGVNQSPVSYPSPKTFDGSEGQTVNLLAYDNQTIGNYDWVFNDIEAPLNKGVWKRDKGGDISEIGYTQLTNYELKSNDDDASFKNFQSKNFRIYRNNQTEFDGTVPSGVVTHIVKQNSGNVPHDPINVNGKTLNFGYWIGTSGDNFTPTDNTTLTAFYKYPNHSNTSTAFSNSSQKKVCYYGWKVYESAGNIWLEQGNQIMNGGKPVNDLTEGPEAKSPSLDYFIDPYNGTYIYIVYQQKTTNGKYKIKLAKFNESGQKIFNLDVMTSTIDYSAIDVTPVIAVARSYSFADGNPKFLIVWRQQYEVQGEITYQNGLYFFGGIDEGSSVEWYYMPHQKFSSTDSQSSNPTSAVYKNPYGVTLYHVTWQQSDTQIKYRGIYDNWNGGDIGGFSESGSLETPSSGSGITKNTNPSITV